MLASSVSPLFKSLNEALEYSESIRCLHLSIFQLTQPYQNWFEEKFLDTFVESMLGAVENFNYDELINVASFYYNLNVSEEMKEYFFDVQDICIKILGAMGCQVPKIN
ncbi:MULTISPECIES: hypothetical protein [Nostocales]|uniref:Uncharacterized protein n=1 Tax=Tolypothrix bouteillei VB521301 TaxID=1479485 RepID=A0A0C1R1Y4_9CYAN